jgi:3-isopropylmalate dehydrogenase
MKFQETPDGRDRNMEHSMKTYKIAVLGGDGTGPEVVAEGIKVLNSVAAQEGFSLSYTHLDWGGERYLRTGEVLPADGLETLKQFDAIYLGAIGHPDVPPGILERGLLLTLRFSLDQYINLRPVKLYPGVETPLAGKTPSDVDFLVVRENTEDLYCGIGGVFKKGTPDEVATQTSINTRKGADRCLRYAFEACRKRNKKKRLTLVAKTNVLTFAHDLWWRAFEEMGKEYPDIERDYNHVDACCMWMVKNPEHYDTIVTTNMFGDIITDLAAMIQGGMGVAAGGNINPKGLSMFEPMGGSAPKYTGQGKINPIAAIAAAGMMLDTLGEHNAARRIEKAIMTTTPKMTSMGAGRMGFSTSEVGDMVASAV